MMGRLSKLTFVVVAFLLAGCDSKPPACGDEQTIGLVKSIFVRAISDSVARAGLEEQLGQRISDAIRVEVTLIRTRSKTQTSRRIDCDAMLEVTLPERAARSANEPVFRAALLSSFGILNIDVEGKVIKTSIEYSSQITDDSKQQYVESKGQSSLVGALLVLSSMGGLDSMSNPPRQGVVEQTKEPSQTAIAKEQDRIVTRYGVLSVIGDLNAMQLLLNEKKLRDGNGFSLSFHGKYSHNDDDIVLVMNNSGGTACPSQYFFVILSNNAVVKLTPEFGTCSDLPEIAQSGGQITVSMPSGSAGSRVTYVLLDGEVSESGKIIR